MTSVHSRGLLGEIEPKRERIDLREAAHNAVDGLIDDFRRPAWRAGFGAGLLSTAVFARMGARMAPAVLVSTLIALAVEELYGMAEDIHDAILEKQHDPGPSREI